MKQQTRLLLTLTPDFGINNNSLTYVCGTAEAIITLNRDFKIADDYSFFLYKDIIPNFLSYGKGNFCLGCHLIIYIGHCFPKPYGTLP